MSALADGTFPGVPTTDLGWEFYPQGIVEVARALHERYPLPIRVTENGCADDGASGAGSPGRPGAGTVP